jgi:hypothetical protein
MYIAASSTFDNSNTINNLPQNSVVGVTGAIAAAAATTAAAVTTGSERRDKSMLREQSNQAIKAVRKKYENQCGAGSYRSGGYTELR